MLKASFSIQCPRQAGENAGEIPTYSSENCTEGKSCKSVTTDDSEHTGERPQFEAMALFIAHYVSQTAFLLYNPETAR